MDVGGSVTGEEFEFCPLIRHGTRNIALNHSADIWLLKTIRGLQNFTSQRQIRAMSSLRLHFAHTLCKCLINKNNKLEQIIYFKLIQSTYL